MKPGFLIAGAIAIASIYASWKVTFGVAGAAAVIGTVLLYKHQGKLLYMPSMPQAGIGREYVMLPDEEVLVEDHPFKMVYENVYLTTKDGVKIHSWLIRHPDQPSRAPTMIYFHGNAGNISHRLPNVSELVYNVRCNVLMVEYRGYGESEGIPSEAGIMLDTEAALDHLLQRKDIDTTRIFVFGRSLGGAAAIHLASSNPDKVCALIVENTFTSVADMVSVVMPFLKIFKPLINNKWLSHTSIAKVTAPIMFISGDQDELVPPHMMKSLHEAAVNSKYKELDIIAGGTHNETWRRPGYYHQILIFLYRALGGAASW